MTDRAAALDGRAIAESIRSEVAEEARRLAQRIGHRPGLAVVRVGGDLASERYAQQIERISRRTEIDVAVHALPSETAQDDLLRLVRSLNALPKVHGILLQVPLPPQIDQEAVIEAIAPEKDVDGVHPLNAGYLLMGRSHYLVSATALGGLELLRRSGCPIAGRHAVIVGRSSVVGKPLALLLLQENATVTICHSRTPDLGRFTREAEILAVATGRPNLIRSEMVRPGAVVVDFGMNVVDGRLVGDVADDVWEVASAVTPVPGGTGPMTNAILLANTVRAAAWQYERQSG